MQPSDTETDDGENSSEEDFDDDDTYGEFAQLRCESVGPLKVSLNKYTSLYLIRAGIACLFLCQV